MGRGRCLSAIEFTTRRNHGRLSAGVPSKSNGRELVSGYDFCSASALHHGELFSSAPVGTPPVLPRSQSQAIDGDDNGTRNTALAARRADPGDHSVMAVLRTLSGDRFVARVRLRMAGPVFFGPGPAMTPRALACFPL
jgi:hypothetical protein